MNNRCPLLSFLFLVATTACWAKAPFEYVWGTAHHVMPETHSEESGYFSLCEGNDGRIYVGTSKYGENAYLVEFDPVTEEQRIVVDAHKLCALTAKAVLNCKSVVLLVFVSALLIAHSWLSNFR